MNKNPRASCDFDKYCQKIVYFNCAAAGPTFGGRSLSGCVAKAKDLQLLASGAPTACSAKLRLCSSADRSLVNTPSPELVFFFSTLHRRKQEADRRASILCTSVKLSLVSSSSSVRILNICAQHAPLAAGLVAAYAANLKQPQHE
ncbi:uncharacterized protein LOC117136975 [Drosophila mauritiana]|uniref:Uncharacterized protein LOC117136975 n=1 Tax=Drosophila mauritiana TaxID=7226 RepID=A0A6P8JU24_DROMA|nr:uncharacterized protein LOC117136975 [Drosophila mauritiana]